MIRSRLTELRQQAVESLSNSRARTQLNTLWPVVLGFLTGTITGAFAHACLRLVVKFWPRSRSPALALWARISQARRSAPYLRTRTGVAISGLIVAWPRESFFSVSGYPVYVVNDLRLWGWCDAYSASSFRKWGLLA